MRKLRSLKINREFYIDETRTDPWKGIPCFNHKEIALMKSRELSNEELNLIFDLKGTMGVVIESLEIKPLEVKETPREEIGYKKDFRTRAEIALEWGKKCRDTINNSTIEIQLKLPETVPDVREENNK